MRTKNWSSVATEKDVESACDRLMAAIGWTAVRFSQARATMQTPGIPTGNITAARHDQPDTILPRAVESFWFECKRDGGKQSRYQRDFQEMCETAGEHYVLGGLAELTTWLERRGIIRLSFKDTWKATGS
jgi:hypothetical protein